MIHLTHELITKIIKTDEDNDANITVLDWSLDNDAVKSGDNFCSDLCRLLVNYKKSSEKLTKSFFLKTPHTSQLHKYNTRYGIEIREFLVYTELIPKVMKTNDHVFAPKFYHVDENYSMILEDLSTSGYRVPDRIDKLDFDHCQLVFKCLARFHAYSVKLKQLSMIPRIFETDTFFLATNPDFSHLKPVFAKAYDCFLRTFDPYLVEKYSSKLHYFRKNLTRRIAKEVEGADGCFKVLNHGDIWSSNIMFKYNTFGNVSDVKFIDFQLCRWASPAFDILHFCTTSMKFDVFEKCFDLLLEIYLDTLNNTLRFLGCDVYPMEDLIRDIRNTYGFGILGFTVLTPVIMAESDDPVNLASILEDPEAENKALEKTYRQQNYQDFAKKWFLYYVSTGVLVY